MKLLLAEAKEFSPVALAELRKAFEVSEQDLDRAGLLEAVATADLLWVRLRNFIDEEVFAAAPRLKAVITNTTGLNHIDLGAAEGRGIAVLSLKGEEEFLATIPATAELTIGLLLALMRRIPAAALDAASGEWNRYAFKGHDLRGKTAGIVGYGRLGRQVGKLLEAFGMRVLAATRPPLPVPEPGVEILPLAEMLPQCDVVSLHVDLNETTEAFFGKAEFELMKPSAVLINTSRGEVLDEAALLAALESNGIAGAALDVICNEQDRGRRDRPVIRYAAGHEQLIVTPHIGGFTHESLASTEDFLAEKVIARFADTPNPDPAS